jgi:hypothetical protein
VGVSVFFEFSTLRLETAGQVWVFEQNVGARVFGTTSGARWFEIAPMA